MAGSRLVNIICVGQNDPDWLLKRDILLMSALSKQPGIGKILFVEPVVSPLYFLKLLNGSISSKQLISKYVKAARGLRRWGDSPNLYTDVSFGVVGYHHYAFHFPRFRRIQSRFQKRRLRRKLAQLRMQDYLVLWIYLPLASELVGTLGERLVCYDRHDDHTLHPGVHPAVRTEIVRCDEALIRAADLVFVASRRLADRLINEESRGRAVPVQVLPCGVDVRHFEKALLSTFPTPPDIVSLGSPILGYVGLIQERVDLDLVAYIAKVRPNWQLVFVGPILPSFDVSSLTIYDNVHFLGHRDYVNLPGYLKSFDVALVPHRVNQMTDSMDPIKLYQYLAAGKPVVSTAVAGADQFSGLVSIAADKEAFIQAIECALASDTPALAKRRSLAMKEHAWKSRAKAVMAQLNTIIERLGPESEVSVERKSIS